MVTPADRTACPDPERLAEFIEGRLKGAARADVTAHLADCDACRQVFAHIARDGGFTVVPFYRRPKVQAAAGVLALAASLIVVVRVQPELNPFRRPTPYEELVAAAAGRRSVEGRVTGLSHTAAADARRSGSAAPDTNYEILAAAAKLQALAQVDPAAENLRALGVAHLLTGNHDEAVSSLERAAAASPQAATLCDLAAAYQARGVASNGSEDYARALAAAERGITADQSALPCYFNRALALDALRLTDAARRAWDDYLARDASGGWADEARARRDRPTSQLQQKWDAATAAFHADGNATALVSASPQYTRELFEDSLLPEWAAQVAAGGPAAEPARLQAIAVALAARGERFPAAIVAELTGRPADVADLARGVSHLSAGKQAYESYRFDEAIERFAAAAGVLARVRSAALPWAEVQQAAVLYFRRDFPRARAITERLRAAEQRGSVDLGTHRRRRGALRRRAP
jgi:tetratricopeptide (TPR) repeat protein